jgi:hypothetical protein
MMAKHENPQAPAKVFRPQGLFPSAPGQHRVRTPTMPPNVRAKLHTGPPGEQVTAEHVSAEANPNQTAAEPEDLGDVIRAIEDMAGELFTEFFAVPDVAEPSGRVDPEKFDAATRYAFVAVGNALDYAIRLVSEKGRALRIKKLRRELSDEMRAAGITGDPDGESDTG